jgi:hypothetical protein
MKRLLASVAISALALSGAAFAADAPTAVHKDQAPMAATTAPAKPALDDSHAKKPTVTKKSDKSSMNVRSPSAVQTAQGSAASTKPALDDSHAKKPGMVKKSDDKASTATDSTHPSTSTTTTTTTKPAVR